jgi:RimJ/RimL family protein N-acetyltransferase
MLGAMKIVLRPIAPQAAAALAAGQPPPGVRVASDYPTEFSAGVGQSAGAAPGLGPYFVHRAEDDVVVGEIGAAFTGPGTLEVGYAIVKSCWGQGYATDAVRALAGEARGVPEVKRLVAHTPLDRPASGRVLQKAGFALLGETQDEHEGQILRVHEWELVPTR